MISRIIVGAGTNRTVVPMVRDRDQRRQAARILRNVLFPSGQPQRRSRRERTAG